MVIIDTGDKERVEQILYGNDTRKECKVILEMFGVPKDIHKTVINKANDTFTNIDIETESTGKIEIEFLDNRVDYSDIKGYTFRVKQYVGGELSDNRTSFITIDRMIENADTRGLIDEIGNEAFAQASRQFDAYLKPIDRIERIDSFDPRPKLAFEIHYDVPRGASLKSVKDDMYEMIDEGLMGNIGEIELLEDRGVIMMIPLKSVFSPDEFNTVEFDMSGIAEKVAEEMTGREMKRSPRMERVILTCTEI